MKARRQGHSTRILAKIVFALSMSAAVADDTPPEREALAEQARTAFDEIAAELDLTAEQEEQVRGILEDNTEQREALMQEFESIRASNDSRRGKLGQLRDLRGEMQALTETTRSELSEILDDEQMATFNAIAEQRKAELRDRMRNRTPR
jgi:Spy/CpxP family protein refolding chaperone